MLSGAGAWVGGPRSSMSGLVFIVRLDILGAGLCFGPRLVKVFAGD
jgi:hypothetical protein